MSENCTFGELLHRECHRGNYGTRKLCKNFSELEENQQQVVILRSAVDKNIFCAIENPKICLYHIDVYVNKFTRKQISCCDPYKIHRKKIALRLNILNIEMCTHINNKLLSKLKPGEKLCRKCYEIVKKEMEDDKTKLPATIDEQPPPSPGSVDTRESGLSAFSTNSNEDVLINAANKTLEELGQTPIKLHGLNESQRLTYCKRKITQTVQSVQDETSKRVARALKVEPSELAVAGPSSRNVQTDLMSFESFLNDLKLKIKSSTYQQQISLLTLAPVTWSVSKISEEFGVSSHQVRKARQLKQSLGTILPEVCKKAGNKLPQETILVVRAWYEEDSVSRVSSNVRDSVSVFVDGKKERKQKRFMLLSIRDTFLDFKDKNPTIKIGFNSFASLRPEWCISIATALQHNVCSCMIHGNLKLLTDKIGNKDISYKELFDHLVCDRENKICMTQRCNMCPGIEGLRNWLQEVMLSDRDVEEYIYFKQWTQTRGVNLESKELQINDFINLVCQQADDVTEHHFITKMQSKYLRELKSNLPYNTAIAILDFSENYAFPIQNSTQAYYYDKKQATLHTGILYYKDNENDSEIMIKCTCVISDELTHDATSVSAYQKKVIVPFITDKPHIKHIVYFSDGAGSQYKNCKNLRNLCYHQVDFGPTAEWNTFTTSHGKTAGDGIGATTKFSATRAALRATGDQGHIVTPYDLFTHGRDNIKNISYYWCPSTEVAQRAVELKERFENLKTVPGTRSHHKFVPETINSLKIYRMSNDIEFTRVSFLKTKTASSLSDIREGCTVAVADNNSWQLGVVKDCSDRTEICVALMVRENLKFTWPRKENILYYPYTSILSCVDDSKLKKSGNNSYIMIRGEARSINIKHDEFKTQHF
jgi:hypothetical protein